MNILSLFSGIGGIDLGLESCGFKTVAFCEFDKDCTAILNKHWKDVPVFRDVKELTIKHLIDFKIDVMVGGFPCQDISFAGRQDGIINGERSSLWREFGRLINEVRPKYAIIENVEHLRKNGLGVVLADLTRIGYDAEWYTLTATGTCNLPHQRKRLFIIAYPSSQRQHECIGKERHIQINKERKSQTLYSNREGCELEFKPFRQILSKGFIDSYRATFSGRESSFSGVCRVTDGIPDRIYEKERKVRIKQLGNAVVPDIAKMIGLAIIEREKDILNRATLTLKEKLCTYL
jgi:DNA (cytosine-5)-methyltransferase 1